MKIEYIKIKSFGDIENFKTELGDLSQIIEEGRIGLSALTAFLLYLFYGKRGDGFDVSEYLTKQSVAGGSAVVSGDGRRFIVAREESDGVERSIIKDAQSDVEISIDSSPGEFFFSRGAVAFLYGDCGIPVDISSVRDNTRSRADGRENTEQIRDQLETLRKRQIKLGSQRMLARGINAAERLNKARAVQAELLENEKLLASGKLPKKGGAHAFMTKKTLIVFIVIAAAFILLGLLLLTFAQKINVSSVITFGAAAGCVGLGLAIFLWLGLFKLIAALAGRGLADADSLRTRRHELTDKLDILLDGCDFNELEQLANATAPIGPLPSASELEAELEQVNNQIMRLMIILGE